MKMMNLISKRLNCLRFTVFLFAISSYSAGADTRIAVLEFHLKDVTLTTHTPQELERTASIKPLLQSALEKEGGYEVVPVNMDVQTDYDPGFGYLFNHHDVAADLGEKYGAEYVVVGRVHKPSALFAYLMAHLVDVKKRTLVGDYIVEVKGPQKKITEKGVATLAKKIHRTIHP